MMADELTEVARPKDAESKLGDHHPIIRYDEFPDLVGQEQVVAFLLDYGCSPKEIKRSACPAEEDVTF